MKDIKTCEDIRKSMGLSTEKMAELIGVARRTYYERIKSERPWLLEDLINLCRVNDGKPVKVDCGGKNYIVNITEEE